MKQDKFGMEVFEDNDEPSKTDIFNDYMDSKKLHRFEGDRGLKNLNTLTSDLGYKENGLQYGSSLEQFLSDNPGCQEAIVNWIEENLSDDQVAELESWLYEDEEPEENE